MDLMIKRWGLISNAGSSMENTGTEEATPDRNKPIAKQCYS